MGGIKGKAAVCLLAAALVLGALAGICIWIFFLGGINEASVVSASVDGQITYNADAEIRMAMEKWEKTGGQAAVIGSDASQNDNTIALAFCGLSDPAENDRVARLLEEYGYNATFFISGMEAAENEAFVQSVRQKGNWLGSMGSSDGERLQEKNQSQLIETFVRGRKVLTTLTNLPTDLLFCAGTSYPANVRQAAFASGFQAVVEPGKLLESGSLEGSQEASRFVKGLGNGELVMISMEKLAPALAGPRVEPDIPAKDKKAGAEEAGTLEEESEQTVPELVEELLFAMKAEGIQTVPVDTLAARNGEPWRRQSGKAEAAPPAGAMVYRSFLTEEKAAALALWGLPEAAQLEEMAALLKANQAGATFFVTKREARERAEEIRVLEEQGFSIGNGGGDQTEGMGEGALYQEIVSSGNAVNKAAKGGLMAYLPIGNLPLSDKPSCAQQAGEPPHHEGLADAFGILRRAAEDAGYWIASPQVLTRQTNLQSGAVHPGDLYGIDLTAPQAMETLEQMLSAIRESGLSLWDAGSMQSAQGKIPALTDSQIERLREVNRGRLAKPTDYVYTTERAMSFLFFGLKNKPVMADIESRLAVRGANGTFFATFEELQTCQEQIEALLRAGNELGVAFVESAGRASDFESTVRYLHSCRVYMSWRYGVEPSTLFFPYENPKQQIQEAASAMGLQCAGRGISMVQSRHRELTEAEIPAILNRDFAEIHLTRGVLVYFNGNYYQNDKELEPDYRGSTVCGSLMEAVFEGLVDTIAYRDTDTGEIAEDSRYQVKSSRALMNSPDCYELTADASKCEISADRHVLAELKDDEARFEYMSSRYVGSLAADKAGRLPGFSGDEIKVLDTSGRFTNQPILFLSFDDWGTDQALNPLLYVLKKHGVKATFFVRANYVKNNPNLLRAIAGEGHEIASHGYNHLPLANPNAAGEQYASLTEEETNALRVDLAACYGELYKYVGDVTVGGVRALSKNFRPPTLAVSKIGLSQVFDVGYSYSVSGDFSSHDYEAESQEELINQFVNGVGDEDWRIRLQNGSCLVMHMSDNSRYTADALDQMIPVWKEQGYRFSRIDRVLDETGGGKHEGSK